MSLDDLVVVSEQLNYLSLELDKYIEAMDAVLQKLNIGLVCWVPVENHANINLGYYNMNKKWGIAIYRRPDKDSEEKEQIWFFHSAPRAYRIQAIAAIPKLLEGLTKTTEATIERLKDKTQLAKVFVEAMQEINKENKK